MDKDSGVSKKPTSTLSDIMPLCCQTLPREVETMRWMGQPQAGQSWEGASLEQLEAWGCIIAEKPDNDGAIWIGAAGDEEMVPVGYWIVKDPDESEEFWPEPPEKFAMWFVPARQPSPAQPPDEVARALAADIVSYIFDDYPDSDQVRGDAELEVANRISASLREAEQHGRLPSVR